jgi:small subunit ribosomal protein S7
MGGIKVMRGKSAPKRKILGDIKYNDTDIAKFINYIMERGKKSTAERIVYECLDIVSQKTKQDAVDVFDQAVKNISPTVEIRGRRVGGANYQVPVAVRSERSYTLGCRWLITAAKSRKGKKMAEKLAEGTEAYVRLVSQIDDNAYGSYARALVKINNHVLKGGTGTVGV